MEEIFSLTIKSEAELKLLSENFFAAIEFPAVVILEGVVGAGKTTFSKYITGNQRLGSPTYSVIYEGEDFVHADFYRIKAASEIVHLELPLYQDEKKYFLIEWGLKYLEYVKRELGDEYRYYLLKIDIGPENDERKFTLSCL